MRMLTRHLASATPRLARLLGVTGIMLGLAFAAACGSGTPTSEESTQPTLVTYILYSAPCPTSWDPAVEVIHSAALGNIYETLIKYEGGKLVPVLATEWSSNEAGTVWTFKLRQGVKFHGGSTFTSESVKLTVERAIKMATGNSYIWGCVDTIDTPDDYTVVFNLKYGAALDKIVTANLGAWIQSAEAIKAHPDTEWWAAGNEDGTGPYKLKNQEMGTQCLLERFADYWGGWDGDRAKAPDLAIIKKVSEAAAERQMVQAGDADIAGSVAVEDLPALAKEPSLTVVNEPSFLNHYGEFNTKLKPLDDPRVRQAICYAFPYDDAIEAGRGGYAKKAYGPIAPGLGGYDQQNATVVKYDTNLDKAKQLLAEAGYPNGGFGFDIFYVAGLDELRKSAELAQQALSELGIDAKIRSLTHQEMNPLVKTQKGPQGLYFSYWWPTWPTAYDELQNLFHSQNPTTFNYMYVKDPQLDAAMDEGNKLEPTDPDAAYAKYAEATKIISENAYFMPVYDMDSIAVVNKRIQNFSFNANYAFQVWFYDLQVE